MGLTKHDKKMQKTLAKGLKKARKAQAKALRRAAPGLTQAPRGAPTPGGWDLVPARMLAPEPGPGGGADAQPGLWRGPANASDPALGHGAEAEDAGREAGEAGF